MGAEYCKSMHQFAGITWDLLDMQVTASCYDAVTTLLGHL